MELFFLSRLTFNFLPRNKNTHTSTWQRRRWEQRRRIIHWIVCKFWLIQAKKNKYCLMLIKRYSQRKCKRVIIFICCVNEKGPREIVCVNRHRLDYAAYKQALTQRTEQKKKLGCLCIFSFDLNLSHIKYANMLLFILLDSLSMATSPTHR